MAKRKKKTGSGSINRKSGYGRAFYEKVPIPPEIYQHVKEDMWHLSLDELKKQLDVSKRVARALRNGVQIEIPYGRLIPLKAFIGIDRRYCLRALVKLTIEEKRYRQLYIELNHYLAKVIAEMPEEITKLTRGGWMTRHIDFLSCLSPWKNQLIAIQWLFVLKRWFSMIHTRYPEFDQDLFEGSGLFDIKPAAEIKSSPNEQNSPSIRKARRKKSSSRKSFLAANKNAQDKANSMLRQFPPRPSFHGQST